MSYNVAICTPPMPLDDDAAWGALDALIDAEGPVPQVFRTLHDRLTARYPASARCQTNVSMRKAYGVMVRC